MNELTNRLLAEGYDKDHQPEYAQWTNWNHFEYTVAVLKETIWEAPCGLIKKGCGYENGSHLGVTYCPENDNPRFGCPYYDEVPCPHRIDTNLIGWNCIFHQIVRGYDYEISVEKLWDEWDNIKSQAWKTATSDIGYCRCMTWNRENRKYIARHNVVECIRSGCKNEICAVTKKPRNLQKVNIYYDILRVWRYQKGLLTYEDKKPEKGVRRFPKAFARSDAEIWLKLNGDNDVKFQPKLTSTDRQERHFSEYHGKNGFRDYDWFEFSLTVQNIRIEYRERRDLAQDLADIADGIEVVHAGDVTQQKAQEKRNRKLKRQTAKQRRLVREQALNNTNEPESAELLELSLF